MPRELLRLLDANYNRAKEASRVIEDLLRFVYQMPDLTRKTKILRHQITKLLLTLPVSYHSLVKMRDTESDSEKSRVIYPNAKPSSLEETMIRNLKRAQESLRVLEESSKMISRKHAAQFQKLRFDFYALEKEILRKL